MGVAASQGGRGGGSGADWGGGGGYGDGRQDSDNNPAPPLGQLRGSGRMRSIGNLAGGSRNDDGATCVHVKIMPLIQTKGCDVKSFKITSTGGVLQGGMAPEVRDVAREYEKMTSQSLARIAVDDRRAQQLMVTCIGDDYYLVPSPELFSRHTGTCRVLGDKHQRTMDHELQIGDFLRIGSVGLIVSELHTGEGSGQSITERDLYYLREDAGAIKEDLFALEEAVTAADEASSNKSPGRSPRLAQCYMCFDDEDTSENPLIAPCLCKGGTRYVHLTCLQKWQLSAGDDKGGVVSSVEKKNNCKVCKSKYKTHVRVKDGRLLPLMVHQLPPPFICFLVVTRHETAEALFNTQFQLSFSDNKQIVIGRSRNCQMVLDYRTVSTQHATVTYRKGAFYFRDLSSSNGSMLNIRRPLKLPYNQWIRVRYGRSIVAFKAKKSWMRRKLSSMGSTIGAATAAAAGMGSGGAGSNSNSSQRQLDTSSHHDYQANGGGGGGGGRPASSSSSSASTEKALPPSPHTVDEEYLELLEALCRIDMTSRIQVGNSVLSPQNPYMSIAGESMSPSAIGAALFQMHLQGSSRRAFGPGGADLDGSLVGVGENYNGENRSMDDSARRKSRPALSAAEQGNGLSSAALRDVAFGVRFVHPQSPMADSQVSQLST